MNRHIKFILIIIFALGVNFYFAIIFEDVLPLPTFRDFIQESLVIICFIIYVYYRNPDENRLVSKKKFDKYFVIHLSSFFILVISFTVFSFIFIFLNKSDLINPLKD
jgi:hypothetical protein